MMKFTTRHLTLLLCAGLSLTLLLSEASARPTTRNRKASAPKPEAPKPDKSEIEKLIELTRRAQEAAEQAQAEARRAREHSEALQQRLEKTEREFELLRQMLAGNYSVAPNPAPPTSPISPEPRQQTAAQKPDDRLANLEDQVEINTAQLREHAQTKIESGSRFKLRLYGEILVNTYFNSTGSADNDVPTIAFPDASTNGRKRNNLGTTLRQSKIGLAMSGPRIGNAKLSGDIELDFWGSSIARYDADVLGSLRIRTASVRLDWDRTTLAIGQMEPMISPLNPTSLAASWILPMAATGNLWQWRPQITVEHRASFNESSSLILQAGLLPNFNDIIGAQVGSFAGTTSEGDPGYEGRVAFRRTLENDRQFEIGFGGYGERKVFPFDRRGNSYALTGDWQIPLGNRLNFTGEAYYGQSINLGERAGISIDRLYATNGNVLLPTTVIRGIRTAGGWAQLSFQATPKLEFNFAAGKDDPNNKDILRGNIGNFTRFKNQAASANFIYFLTPNFEMSLEYRRTMTDYAPGRRTNNHFNLAFGYLF